MLTDEYEQESYHINHCYRDEMVSSIQPFNGNITKYGNAAFKIEWTY